MEIETYVVYWIASKISKTKQNKIQCNFLFFKNDKIYKYSRNQEMECEHLRSPFLDTCASSFKMEMKRNSSPVCAPHQKLSHVAQEKCRRNM